MSKVGLRVCMEVEDLPEQLTTFPAGFPIDFAFENPTGNVCKLQMQEHGVLQLYK